MEAHFGEFDLPSGANEEERRDAGRIIAARHIQVGVQEHREAQSVGPHQFSCFRGAVLGNYDHAMAIRTQRLGQTLQIRNREAAGRTIGLDKGEQEWAACPRRLRTPIGSVQLGQ